MINKFITRREIKDKRKFMSPELVKRLSEEIARQLFVTSEYRSAETVCFYISANNEVDTTSMIANALHNGKRVAAPKVRGREMDFVLFSDLSELEEGAFGILEPQGGQVIDTKNALLIMPGVAFDESCNRIGYGGGFYDRYLARHDAMARIALAYEIQIVKELESEQFDVKPDMIITEKRIIRNSGYYNNFNTERRNYMLEELGKSAKRASRALAGLGQEKKNETLLMVAKALLLHKNEIIAENDKDIDAARLKGVSEAMIDRLRLTDARFEGMAEGIRQVVALDDPIGEVLSMKERPNGLLIGEKRVPLGVIGIIYESRPNVTVDAFALCFKTSNAVILRGGSDAIHSNMALVKVIRDALLACHVTPDAVSLVTNTDRSSVTELIRMNEYLDVIIPRGGHGLIQNVINNATVPVIETGTGNCHIYIDKDADLNMAIPIVHNAKLQRLGVCNACESLVVHKDIAKKAIPLLVEDLRASECEMRGDEAACRLDAYIDRATKEDFGTEYLAKIISVKIVEDIDEAIDHINKYSTGHSEAIITDNYQASMKFLSEIDSAAVYVNASTRFTDGFEFGFGAEIGISTQKLHARGPMGLLALTTTKYIIFGNGQIRG